MLQLSRQACRFVQHASSVFPNRNQNWQHTGIISGIFRRNSGYAMRKKRFQGDYLNVSSYNGQPFFVGGGRTQQRLASCFLGTLPLYFIHICLVSGVMSSTVDGLSFRNVFIVSSSKPSISKYSICPSWVENSIKVIIDVVATLTSLRLPDAQAGAKPSAVQRSDS